ncbi:hypothetical protein Gorai_024935, partial [Gossypium raimondii]|nr:hypothetical protein [Gossypium raimondii]
MYRRFYAKKDGDFAACDNGSVANADGHMFMVIKGDPPLVILTLPTQLPCHTDGGVIEQLIILEDPPQYVRCWLEEDIRQS